MEFKPFAKIARLSRDVVVTEKLDGTNGQIFITELPHISEGDNWPKDILHPVTYWYGEDASTWGMWIGSRNRWITPEKDNFGFATWCLKNVEELKKLGPGKHFGEWWGQGIQRGYGLTEKRFSLFNIGKWDDENKPACCHLVPVLYEGPFDTQNIQNVVDNLEKGGSRAAPGFMDPEGIIVYHSAANQLFKKTIKNDAKGKWDNS